MAKKQDKFDGFDYTKNAAKAWHLSHVYEDPDFIKAVESLPKRKLPDSYEDYRRIAQEFNILPSDVDIVHEKTYDYDPSSVLATGLGYRLDWDFKEFKITLDRNITKRQFLYLWENIYWYQKRGGIKTPKQKSPVNTGLLYAIFKARKNHSFPEIYSLYEKGKLPYYLGKKGIQFSSAKNLEDYYHRYYSTVT